MLIFHFYFKQGLCFNKNPQISVVKYLACIIFSTLLSLSLGTSVFVQYVQINVTKLKATTSVVTVPSSLHGNLLPVLVFITTILMLSIAMIMGYRYIDLYTITMVTKRESHNIAL